MEVYSQETEQQQRMVVVCYGAEWVWRIDIQDNMNEYTKRDHEGNWLVKRRSRYNGARKLLVVIGRDLRFKRGNDRRDPHDHLTWERPSFFKWVCLWLTILVVCCVVSSSERDSPHTTEVQALR